MGRNILLGFAGPGEVSPASVKDLLRQKLKLGPEEKNGLPTFPDGVDAIRVVMPVSDDYLTKTMGVVLDWVDYADLPIDVVYDEETRKNRKILVEAEERIEARNIASAMVEHLVTAQKNGDLVWLIVAWGDEGDDHTEMLVELASVKNIKMLDLTRGLDDLRIEGYDATEPEPEPEEEKPTRRRRTTKTAEPEPVEESVAVAEEPDKPAPRRGRPRKTAETSPAPAEDTDSGSLDEDVARGRQAAQKATSGPANENGDVVLRALTDARWLVRSLDSAHAAMTGRETPEASPLYRLLEQAIETYQPPAKGGRPRRDGSPAQARGPADRSIKEYLNGDGEWVRAPRGRLPKGVKTRTVDPKTDEVLSTQD